MPRLLVAQHVPHEGLGTFAHVFTQAGCEIVTLNAADPQARWPRVADVHGLVIMGGPMAVYERQRHPFLIKELHFLRNALQEELPVLGVCLGAQLLAHALGAEVKPNSHKEIGWYPLTKEPDADGDMLFAPFDATETVFQWHGDTFALPRGAVQLASSPLCAQQAFRWRDNVYGLQFHLEVTADIIGAWLRVPENATELTGLRDTIDPSAMQQQSPRHLPRLQVLARHAATAFYACVRTCETTSR